jgi:hypothetical protein
MYLTNKEFHCTCKACCIISVLFSTNEKFWCEQHKRSPKALQHVVEESYKYKHESFGQGTAAPAYIIIRKAKQL